MLRCSIGLPLQDATARTLGREHALLHVCADAARSGRRSTLRWAGDAWLLLRRSDGIDWPYLLEAVSAARLALPLAVMLRFLAEALAAPVPAEVLLQLTAQAARSDDLDHEVALLVALVGNHGRMRRTILTMPGWSNRRFILRPLILPSPAALRALDGSVRASFLPFYYAARPARYVARRLLRLRPAWTLRH